MTKTLAVPTTLASMFLSILACAPCRADDDPPAPPQPPALFPPVWQPTETGDRPPPPPPAIDFNPWAVWERSHAPPRTVKNTASGDWGSLTANSVVGDAAEDAGKPRAWKTDESWRCPVAGPLFAFGQVGGAGTEIAQQDTKVTGQTGLGCKWSPFGDAEFTVRGGPSVTYTDALRPDRLHERSEVLLEVQARWPLLGKIGLEYQGKAAPALTPLDHDWLDQDLGLAAPIGPGGKVRLGARRHWDDAPEARPSPDSLQLYFGFELAR